MYVCINRKDAEEKQEKGKEENLIFKTLFSNFILLIEMYFRI